ncbi:MAG: hypothetical protein QW273_02565 [Candidatus Pacearchaeota archaeon]
MKKESENNKPKKIHISYISFSLAKISIFFFTLFLLSIVSYDVLRKFLDDWRWAFLTIAILLSLFPIKELLKNEE